MGEKLQVSEETRKFLEDLEKEMIPWDPKEYIPPKSIRERVTEWVHSAPGFVLGLCKILMYILDVGGVLFMIGGGIAALIWAWAIWRSCTASGWRGLLDWNTVYIAGYVVALVIINKLRLLMFRIVEGV